MQLELELGLRLIVVNLNCVFLSVPALQVATEWNTYLTGTGATLEVHKSPGPVNTMVPYTHGPTTGYARLGNKEWDYCSRRGRCNQVNGTFAALVPSIFAVIDCLR